MTRPMSTGRTATALAAFGLACCSIAACGSDDGPSDSGASRDTTVVVAEDAPADTSPATDAATTVADEPTTPPVDTEPESSEPAPTTTGDLPLTDDGLRFIGDIDPATAALAVTFCTSFGDLDEPDGVDQLMALVSDDIVIDDVVTGETYRGRADVRAYVAGLYDNLGIDGAVCSGIDLRQGGSWFAGSYMLYAGDTRLSQGIAAVKVDDAGLVERQVNFYTPGTPTAAQRNADLGSGVLSMGMQYCSAWGDPYGGDLSDRPDPERIVSLMSAEPTIHGTSTIQGVEQIRSFAENAVWDRNECSLEFRVLQWEAVANRFFDDDTGKIWEGVNVIALDENGLVTDHWAFLEIVS